MPKKVSVHAGFGVRCRKAQSGNFSNSYGFIHVLCDVYQSFCEQIVNESHFSCDIHRHFQGLNDLLTDC